jgi:hypothetical protein
VAEPADLVVLGGEPGYCQRLELLEVAQGGVAVGELVPEFVVVFLQPGDLGVARIGGGAGGAERRQALLELFLQVRVGAVEGRAGDPCFSELEMIIDIDRLMAAFRTHG